LTWERRTFHECVAELKQTSDIFRLAYLSPDSTRGRAIELKRSSIEGVELLRILALAVRSEQDAGLLPKSSSIVGAMMSPITKEEIQTLLLAYQPPISALSGFSPLPLREALNKIAHTNVRSTNFAVDRSNHDLLLSGKYKGVPWLAILSVPAICEAISTFPDASIPGEA
jgi:hypothetical protein